MEAGCQLIPHGTDPTRYTLGRGSLSDEVISDRREANL